MILIQPSNTDRSIMTISSNVVEHKMNINNTNNIINNPNHKYKKVNNVILFGKSYQVKHKNNKTVNNRCCGYIGYVYKKCMKPIIRVINDNIIGIETCCMCTIIVVAFLLFIGGLIANRRLMDDIIDCRDHLVRKIVTKKCVPILLEQCKQQMEVFNNQTFSGLMHDTSSVLSCYKTYNENWYKDGLYLFLTALLDAVIVIVGGTAIIVALYFGCVSLDYMYNKFKTCVNASIKKLDNSIPEIETDEMV